jgi:hypothetical protein
MILTFNDFDFNSVACPNCRVFLMNHWDFVSLHLGWIWRKLGLLMSILPMLATQEYSLAQDFTQRTQDAGLGSVAGTNGVALADYDRDGDLDIYFVVHASYQPNEPTTWNRLFSNRGDGTFSDVTIRSGLAGQNSNPGFSYMGNKIGAAWGDYDNDGWPDIFLTHFGPNQLFHNNGNGTFTEVTKQAGVAGGQAQVSTSALWFDYDRDGDLDLYVSNWEDYAVGPRDKRNRMYENLGDGKFKEVSEASGLADAHQTWMSVAIDANNDDYLDLFLANDFGPIKLYVNNHDKTFQDRTTDFGLEGEFQGMGLAVADCDGNGYFDLYLTNVTEMGFEQAINPLFLNTGKDYFIKKVDAGVALAGWGWGTEFFDLENDGDEDLVVVNGYFSSRFTKRLFRNESDSNTVWFTEIAKDLGLADTKEARGVAVFDYNDDGHSDILISNFTEAPSLYANPMAQGNWLKIKLEGTVSNRDAFGAVVEVWVNGKSHKKYHHGAQFLAQNIQPLHFGLGDAQSVERITVKWSSGYVDEIATVEVNQTIRIKEKSGLVSGVRQSPASQTTMPKALRLVGNYPNPFNGSTQIRFELGVPGEVELSIINAQGQTVMVMKEFFPAIGKKIMNWDTTARAVGSGVYFYRLKINNEIANAEIGKMIYIK